MVKMDLRKSGMGTNVLLIAGCCALGACGGGPSGNIAITANTPPPAPAPAPPPPPTSVFDTAEFRLSGGLEQLGLFAAYEAGITGAGVVVGSLEGGIDDQHPDLINQIHPASRAFGGDTTRGLKGPGEHGTRTGGIIVAEKNDIGTHGVAFDAQILLLRVDDPTSCSPDPAGVPKCATQFDAIPEAIDFAIAQGVKIIMIARGAAGTQQVIDDAGLTVAFENIRLAFQRAIDAGVLLVSASGNVDAGTPEADNPWFFPNLVDFGPDSLGGLITVGAVNRANETMTWLSPDGTTVRTANMAGAAQDHFLVAPSDVIMVKQDGTTTTFRRPGTSNSAPHVAGVAALLAQAFPNLTGQEIGQILLATAIDLGDPGPDPIFGIGLVNITGAMAPIGTTTVQLAGGDVFALSGTTATVSAAFGDAFSIAGPLSSVMMLDSFERSFMFDLGARVNALAERGINFEALLGREHQLYSLDLSLGRAGSFSFSFYDADRGLKAISYALPMAIRSAMALTRPQMFFQGRYGEATQYGFSYGLSVRQVLDRQNPDFAPAGAFLIGRAFSEGYLGFAEGVQSFGLTRHLSTATSLSLGVSMARYNGGRFLTDGRGDPSTAIDSVMRLTHQKGKLLLRGTFGVLTEKNAILGSRSSGALKLGGGAETFYGRMGASYSLGSGRQFFASASRGLTSVSGAASSFVTGVSSFQTSSYAFGFVDREIFNNNDLLGIAISQPLKVESGHISFSLPTGRDYIADRILFTDSRGGLAPSGRELDLELVYRWRISGVSLAAGAVASWNAGHAKQNRFGGALMIQTSARF